MLASALHLSASCSPPSPPAVHLMSVPSHKLKHKGREMAVSVVGPLSVRTPERLSLVLVITALSGAMLLDLLQPLYSVGIVGQYHSEVMAQRRPRRGLRSEGKAERPREAAAVHAAASHAAGPKPAPSQPLSALSKWMVDRQVLEHLFKPTGEPEHWSLVHDPTRYCK